MTNGNQEMYFSVSSELIKIQSLTRGWCFFSPTTIEDWLHNYLNLDSPDFKIEGLCSDFKFRNSRLACGWWKTPTTG